MGISIGSVTSAAASGSMPLILRLIMNGDHVAYTAWERDVPFMEGYRAFILWQWEKYAFGRNRWEEFVERGGEAHPDWLTSRRLVPDHSLHW